MEMWLQRPASFAYGWNKLIDRLEVKEKLPKNADITNVLVNDLIKL